MKTKLIIPVAVILFFCSCLEKRYGAFTVSGKIMHATTNSAFLAELPFDGKQPIILDSVAIKADGSFELHAIGKEEGLYILSPEGGPKTILVNDSRNIHVQLDVENYKAYTTEGSPASSSLHEFLDNYSKKYNALAAAAQHADSLQQTKASDSSLTVSSLLKDRQLQKLNDFLSGFINSSGNPAIRYYALGMAFKTMSPEEIKKLADAAADKFKGHSGLEKMKNIVDTQIAADPKMALLNKQAPEINFPDTSGKLITLSSLKGKYVLVDFWASWCKPCRQENPNVVAAYNKFKNKNFTVLGVSLDNDKQAWIQAIKQDSLNWNHISDLKQWESQVVSTYKFEGIPFNVLVDPAGKIIAVGLRGHELQKKLAVILK